MLLVAGVVLLVFVAMSGMQWKELLRAQAGASFELNSLPSDVYAAAALAFSLCLAGTVLLSSNFRPVMKTGEAPHECVEELKGACEELNGAV